MKSRTVIALALAALLAGTAGAQQQERQEQEEFVPYMMYTVFTGGWYDTLPLPPGYGDFAWNFDMRWGYTSGALNMFLPWLGAGMDVGIHVNFYQKFVGDYLWLEYRLDMPLEARLALNLGILLVEGFGGITFNFLISDVTTVTMAWIAGGRLAVGPFFAECALLFPTETGDWRFRWGGGILVKFDDKGYVVSYY